MHVESHGMGRSRQTRCGDRHHETCFQMEKYEMVAVHASIRNERGPAQPHEWKGVTQSRICEPKFAPQHTHPGTCAYQKVFP